MNTLKKLSESISADCISGSSVLASQFLERLTKGDFKQDELQNALRLILEAHPDMAILRRAAMILEKIPFDNVPSTAAEFLKSLNHAPQKIAEFIVNILPKNAVVMTYSRSGTVYQALLLASKSGKLSEVILSESRPDMEGRTLAQELSSAKIQTTLTTDGALTSMIESVHAVLVGSDAVTPEHIINKAGTLAVALAANYADKPIYALASTHKFTSIASPRKRSPAQRIWEKAPDGIHITAPLFETVPLALLSAVVCERGLVGIKQIEMIIE